MKGDDIRRDVPITVTDPINNKARALAEGIATYIGETAAKHGVTQHREVLSALENVRFLYTERVLKMIMGGEGA